MKRPRLVLLIAVFAAVLVLSCQDKSILTDPTDGLVPSADAIVGQVSPELVDILITHLYPEPGLVRASQRRWENIQRQMSRDPAAARQQALEMVSDALILLEDGRLQDFSYEVPVPGGDPIQFEGSPLDGVNLLSGYLFEFVGMEEAPEFDEEFLEAEDKGWGTIPAGSGGGVTTENGWAQVTVQPGDSEEDVLITIELVADDVCQPGQLKTAQGCWDFDQYGGGEFERTVEICVADPGPPPEGLTDSEYYVELRVHKQDETTGDIEVLPYVNSTLDCAGFGEETAPPTAEAEEPSVLAYFGSAVAHLFGPEPLGAILRDVRRPPRGIGGTATSFTWFFGAVPVQEEEDYTTLPVGSGGAQEWAMLTPESIEELCIEANPADCPEGSLTEVDLSAVLTEDSSIDPHPWWEVFFYFKPAGEPGPLGFIGSTNVFTEEDNGTQRFSTWGMTLPGTHPELTKGPIDVFAVGARAPEEGGDIFGTEAASYIQAVSEVVEPLLTVSTMGAGDDFSCALRSDGKAFCWGDNAEGQLGDGTRTSSPTPVEVRGGLTFDQLYVGGRGSCGLTVSGDAYCWGSNAYGWLGAGLPPDPEADFSLVPVPVSGGHRFLHLSLQYRVMCGIADDGITYCWGYNRTGALGNEAAGDESNVPVPVTNSGTLGFVRVSATGRTGCGLTETGDPYCWGLAALFGNGSQSGTIFTPTPAVSGMAMSLINGGTGYLCGIDGNQDAYCWGYYNASGSLGNGTTDPAYLPTPVAGGLSFEFVDANGNNTSQGVTCGLTPGGGAYCWGSNNYGEVGGPASDVCSSGSCALTPVPVSGGITFSSIDVGRDHVCGLAAGGELYCWGRNHYGQLGDGTQDDSSVPILVGDLVEAPGAGPVAVTPLVSTLTLRGETLQLTAEAQDQNGDPLIPQPGLTWSSSDLAVATVDASGIVTAVDDGTAVIYATAPDGAEGRATVSVNIIDPVQAFERAMSSGNSEAVVILSDLLADEFGNSGSFLSHWEIDRRDIPLDTNWLEGVFGRLASARTALEWEAARLQTVEPTNSEIGDLLTRAGFLYLAYAQNWCSGVPLDDPNVGVSTADLLNLAVARFDLATSGPISPDFLTAAQVGRARAYLGLGDYNAAAASAATVPTGFSWDISHTGASGEQNPVYLFNRENRRISLPDVEGGTGLPFRSAGDVRVPWTREDGGTAIGTDGVTPHYDLLKYPTADSPMPLATGLEARLIQAEVLLLQNDQTGYINQLNVVRAAFGLPPVTVPATVDERVDLLFEERAFSLFATGQRLWDLRRLVSVYGRSATSVFPSGTTIQGGTYGSDGNLPVPLSARGPGFAGCTVRTH